MNRFIYILPVFFVSLLAAVFWQGLKHDPSKIPTPMIDKPVPKFRAPTLYGKGEISNAVLKGQVTVFNVFASWCIPCRAEHPILMTIAKSGKARVIGLNYKNKPAEAKSWLKQLGNPYEKIATDAKGRIAIDWGVYGVPETFIIDKLGRIRYKHIGPIMPRDLEMTIRPLLEKFSK